MTVKEASRKSGVSVRTLHYYDEIGLLPPSGITESGYRQYNGDSLKRLQQILLFRELQFPLKEIKNLLDCPDFDPEKALEQQIKLLRMRREHLDQLIRLAQSIQQKGENTMDFKPFDTQALKALEQKVRERWGTSEPYQKYREQTKSCGKQDWDDASSERMEQFRALGAMRQKAPAASQVQARVAQLQECISRRYYPCSREMLAFLGTMYTTDLRF